MSSFTHPHVVPNLYGLLSYVEHNKEIIFHPITTQWICSFKATKMSTKLREDDPYTCVLFEAI